MDKEVINLIKLAQNNDQNAIKELIEKNIGLIWNISKKFTNRGYDLDDLFQIGAIGLLKAIKKFDFNFNVKFSTYAVPMIMGEIKRFLRDNNMIKISRPLKEMAIKAKYMQDVLTKEKNSEPTICELARALNVEVEELVMALDADRSVESIYTKVYHQNDGTDVYLIDKLKIEEDSSDKIVDKIVLDEIIKKLLPQEQKIIKLRYFNDKTQNQVASEIGISQVQVSRIEKRVLAKIRKFFE